MMDFLIECYLKLNVMLALIFCLWLGIKKISGIFRFEVKHGVQLSIIRQLFVAIVILLPMALLLKEKAPDFLSDAAVNVPGYTWAGSMSVSGGIDDGLARMFTVGGLSASVQSLLLILMGGGIILAGLRLAVRLKKLRGIIGDATELRHLSGVHILVSNAVSSPFSTLALGKKQVVLPQNLLDSPEDMRLVVKHELQHLRNGDLGWVLFMEVMQLFCFWNPVIYAWHNEFDCLQEYACDEAVVNRGKVNAFSYGNCLLKVATACSREKFVAASYMVPRFSLFLNTGSQLKRRITMLSLERNIKFSLIKSLVYASLSCIGLVLCSLLLVVENSMARDRMDGAERASREEAPVVPVATNETSADLSREEVPIMPVAEDEKPVNAPEEDAPVMLAAADEKPKNPPMKETSVIPAADSAVDNIEPADPSAEGAPDLPAAADEKPANPPAEETPTLLAANSEKPAIPPGREAPRPRMDRPGMIPVTTVMPKYPPRALARGIEGWALVGFTVTQDGGIKDPEIIDSEPNYIFDRPSLEAIAGFRFQPREIDGKAVEVPNVRYLFKFTLAEDEDTE